MEDASTDIQSPSKAPRQNKSARKTVARVRDRLEKMKETRRKQNDIMWDTWDRLMLNIPSRQPEEDWMANVFQPFTMSTVLAILSEITSRRTRWKLLPVTAEDQGKEETLMAITDFLMEKGWFDAESFNRDLDKLVYGTAVWKEYYREDRRTIKDPIINPATQEVERWEEKDIKEFADPYGCHVPLRHFYLDDRATDIRIARDCIERTVMDLADFKVKYSKYKLSAKVKSWGFIKPVSEDIVTNLPPGGDTNEEGDYIPTIELKENEVEVLEYWNKQKDEHILVANDYLVIEEANPYDHKQLPYAMDVCIPKLNSAYGMGCPELLYPLQEEINVLHNQMLDEGHISLHPPIIMDGMTVLDEQEYKLRPGAIISTDGGTAQQLQMRGIGQSHFQLLEETKQAARVASGLDVRFAEAVNPAGNNTATEILRLQEASLRRIGLLTKVLEIKCLPRIGMLRTANIQQFYKDPLKVQQVMTDGDNITTDEQTGEPVLKKSYRTIRTQKQGQPGYSFQEIKPEDIRGNFDVYVVPQSTQPLSQAVLLKRLNVAINTVLASQVALEVVDVSSLFKHFFQQLDLPESIVRDVLKADAEEDFQLAEQENQDMSSGIDVPPTRNPSLQHTAVHLAFIYVLDEQGRQTGKFTPQFEQMDADTRKIFQRHLEGEMAQQAVKGNVQSDKARTPNRQQGMGTQSTPGGEVEATGEGGI